MGHGAAGEQLSKQVLQFAPVLGNPDAPSATQQFARELGFDAVIFAPMIREDKVLGAIGTARHGAGPFDDRQIALIKAFADQAAIAIENVRLFDEVQARTREATEALERQTATAEILASISGSVTDTKPVFDAIVRNLRRLFGTSFAQVVILKDGLVHLASAAHQAELEGLTQQYPRPLDESTGVGRAMLSKQAQSRGTARRSAARA